MRSIELDPLSLAIGRIGFAIICILQFSFLLIDENIFFSSSGVFPVEWYKLFYKNIRFFSVFLEFDSSTSNIFFLLIGLGATFFLLIGRYSSYAFLILAYLNASIVARTYYSNNGGDYFLTIFLLFMAALPTESRLSVGKNSRVPGAKSNTMPLIALLMSLSLVFIYPLSVVMKMTTNIWQNGVALEYYLSLLSISTKLGSEIRDYISPHLNGIVTHSVLAFEFITPLLFLFLTKRRNLIIFLMIFFHFLADMLFDIHFFSYVMIAAWIPLINSRLIYSRQQYLSFNTFDVVKVGLVFFLFGIYFVQILGNMNRRLKFVDSKVTLSLLNNASVFGLNAAVGMFAFDAPIDHRIYTALGLDSITKKEFNLISTSGHLPTEELVYNIYPNEPWRKTMFFLSRAPSNFRFMRRYFCNQFEIDSYRIVEVVYREIDSPKRVKPYFKTVFQRFCIKDYLEDVSSLKSKFRDIVPK